MKSVRFSILLIPLFLACHIEPTDPGRAKGNKPPDTVIAPTPREGSMNNPFRIRLQWHGNDTDGRIKEYQYRIEGPLYDNTWISTPYFFEDFKLPYGWYTIQVRAIDDDGVIDETPDTRRFHVLGPTFDRGILVIDDDNTTDDERDDRKDSMMDSLLIRAGFNDYTVWDYETKFGITETIVFTDKSVDLNGEEYYGLSAYSTVIWYTGTGGENNISKNEGLLTDYLDMGGNLWLSGNLVMQSVLGEVASGVELAENNFGRKYLKVRKAKAALMKTDLLLSAQPGYPDLETKYTIAFSGNKIYLDSVTDQLIPTAEAEVLYTFSHNVYVDDSGVTPQDINAEEFAGTPVALRYIGPVFRVVLCGFPLIHSTGRPPRLDNNILNEDQLVEIVRNVLVNEFGETPN